MFPPNKTFGERLESLFCLLGLFLFLRHINFAVSYLIDPHSRVGREDAFTNSLLHSSTRILYFTLTNVDNFYFSEMNCE